MVETTTIQVTEELAEELHDRKKRKDTYEDVIWRLVEQAGPPSKGIRVPTVEEPDSAAVDALDLPGDGAVEEQRREAVRAVYVHLGEQGRAQKGELLTIAGEIAGETFDSEDSFWKNCIYRALRDLPGVESEGQSGYWRLSNPRE